MAGEPSRKRVIKRIAGHGHHGGAWKVAYADFVTAMMALFMVLWLLASTDSQSRKEISNYFRTGIMAEGDMAMNHAAQWMPSVIEAAPVPPKPGEESLTDTAAKVVSDRLGRLASVDPELAGVMSNVSIKVTEEGVLIEAVDADKGLLFDSASSKLKEPLERFLRVLAPIVNAVGVPIVINGHTDARPFASGTGMSNWDLSYARAAKAREILESSGVPNGQIVGVFARGSSQLYVKDDPMSSSNRRLSILLQIAKPADTKPFTRAQPGEITAPK